MEKIVQDLEKHILDLLESVDFNKTELEHLMKLNEQINRDINFRAGLIENYEREIEICRKATQILRESEST